MSKLAERFITIRKDVVCSKAEAGRHLKVTRSAIGQIETGNTKSLQSYTLADLGLFLTSGSPLVNHVSPIL
jgi:DNA-binding XRE family transcriptional regulator